ncbi:MAG: aminotransferase class III-fold pyridoxal phosphate-dependent enzyme [Clostridiales bacterium]|nr:aminotransferase class III-fold pyridoxal phosphate-dependent enzyme [Clostridiales bacterium]
MRDNWILNEYDKRVLVDIKDFIPEEIFDIHAHIYRQDDLNNKSAIIPDEPSEVNVEVWRHNIELFTGGSRLKGGLLIPFPTAACDTVAANLFLTGQLRDEKDSKGLILIRPEDDPAKVESFVKENPCVIGFKPYHVFSSSIPTMNADISSYLPDWAWKLADRYNLLIMLHLVKDKALADEENCIEILMNCTRYLGAKIVLAHAGRGFHRYNTMNGLKALRSLQNIWFDTSAVCEPGALKAICTEFGPKKLIWGSDFPVSQKRGKCVDVGNGFVWLDTELIRWEEITPSCKPILVGIESLRALKEAADDFGLNKGDISDIFFNNALRLIGLNNESGTKTQDLYNRAKKILPGGTQLLSKRPEMFAPEKWPAYFSEARGCEVWDLDGKHYYDMSSNGIGACLLGFRDPDVTRAVQRRIQLGSMCTLNPPEEVELAELLCDIHSWAEKVRYTRSGGEACAVAARIARATTDRSVIAICGYHGWHDWYLAANLGENDALRGHLLPGLESFGVPKELRNTASTFLFNNREELKAVIDRVGDRLAAVFMEPCRYNDPEPGFLEFVRDSVHKCGALLIFDEITIGWRLCHGGSHLKHRINPDIAVFAKAMGNGHPVGAIIGTKEAMEGAHKSFISSTYWTESVGPVAALTALKKMEGTQVCKHVENIGNLVTGCWKKYGDKYNLPIAVGDGYPCLAHFSFKHVEADRLRTIFTRKMLDKGFLAPTSIYPTLAHIPEIVEKYGVAVDEVFATIADIIKTGDISAALDSPTAHNGFKRLN